MGRLKCKEIEHQEFKNMIKKRIDQISEDVTYDESSLDQLIKFYINQMFKDEQKVSNTKEIQVERLHTLVSEESERDKLSFSIKIPVKP